MGWYWCLLVYTCILYVCIINTSVLVCTCKYIVLCSLQWTVTGLYGRAGTGVPPSVVQGVRRGIATVSTPNQPMEDSRARGWPMRAERVKSSRAQVSNDGNMGLTWLKLRGWASEIFFWKMYYLILSNSFLKMGLCRFFFLSRIHVNINHLSLFSHSTQFSFISLHRRGLHVW